MTKRDPVFWSAAALFVLALVLTAVTHNQFWMALMIGSYLLRPTLTSVGVARKYVDERQMSLHYRSGNVAFAVTIIMCVIFLAKLELENNHDFELFATAIIVGVATKALFNVILAKNYREGAARIIIGAGLMIALFSVLDAGYSAGMFLAALPGVAIAGAGLLSRKYPRPAGILALTLACLLIFLVMTIGLHNTGKLWTQITVALLLGIPLITAGVCLLVGDRGAKDVEMERR
jgi:hypothetical protein